MPTDEEQLKLTLGILYTKLDKLQATLDRIEQRQIKTTKIVEEVQEHEAPVVGSFASSDLGDEKK